MEDLKFYANNFKDIFVKIFNEYDVENKFRIQDVEECRDEKCFNLFEIFGNKKSIFFNVDWSIEGEYEVEGQNEKEYKIKMVIKLSRDGVTLAKTYYYKTYSMRYDWGRTPFQVISQLIVDTSRIMLGWDICEKE